VKEKAMRIRADLKTVLHNDPGNPQILGLANPKIEVEYLSNTSTSLLQPLNQGIFHPTKLASPSAAHLMEVGRSFLSVNAGYRTLLTTQLEDIKQSMGELQSTELNGCW